jgi:4-amino-4-deoxy-L-arabinose transferase-like glycosyltransferase
MVLPALYAVYLLGTMHGWWKRLAHLGNATVLLLAVSLSWAVNDSESRRPGARIIPGGRHIRLGMSSGHGLGGGFLERNSGATANGVGRPISGLS